MFHINRLFISQPCAEVKEEGCVTSNAGFSKNCQNLYRGLLKLVARTHQMETVSSSTQPSNRISVSNVFTPVTDLTLRVDEAFEKLTFSRFERPPCAVAATFCLNTKELTFMTENCLVFGTDSNCCDVVMDRKVCSQLSSKHAVLFFDAISNCFEILNYRFVHLVQKIFFSHRVLTKFYYGRKRSLRGLLSSEI